MNENKYVEVTIIDSPAKMPTSDIECARSANTLSTIHECDSFKDSNSRVRNGIRRSIENSETLKSNIKNECFPSSKQKIDSLRSVNQPFDIDLLLRYYAYNSDMEKSIRKVFEKTDEKFSKDIERGPLVELGAVYKIIELLQRSSSENAWLFAYRFQETLIKLQALIGRYNSKELEQILSSDPSMKICKYCGVISCSKSRNVSIEQRQSPPRTSYFLNTQAISNNDAKMYREFERNSLRKKRETEEIRKCFDTQRNFSPISKRHKNINKDRSSREGSLTFKQRDQPRSNILQQVEIMIAERENGDETQEKIPTMQSTASERNAKGDKTRALDSAKSSKMESQDRVDVSQITKLSRSEEEQLEIKKNDKRKSNSGTTGRLKTNSNCSTVDFPSSILRARAFDQEQTKNSSQSSNKQKEHKMPRTSRQSGDEFDEKVINDISYVKSKSGLNDSRTNICLDAMQKIGIKQNQSSSPVNTASIIDRMAYLARGCVEPSEAKKKEFVSQFDDRAWVQSKYSNDMDTFALHASRDYNPQLESPYRMHKREETNKDKHEGRETLPKNYAERWRWIEYKTGSKNSGKLGSISCLMENDSLENLTKASSSMARSGQSDTTAFSSSSAENLIREWVNPPQRMNKESSVHEEIRKRSDASKHLMFGLNVESRPSKSDEKSIHSRQMFNEQRNLRNENSYKTRRQENQEKFIFPIGQTTSNVPSENSKLTNQKFLDDGTKSKISKKLESVRWKKFRMKQLFKSLTSMKSTKSVKSNDSSAKLSNMSSNNSNDSFRNITRRINYNESSFKTIMDSRCEKTANTLSLYRRILENTEGMDWETFQRFVENLHESQRDLWRDICNAINREAKRITDKGDGVTEVCIEISSVPRDGTKSEGRTRSDEIVFEMDMTLRDVEGFLDSQLVSTEKGQLDNLKRASQVIRVRNDDVCNTEVVSECAE
ncbi:uncharacterized protein LOC128891805 [Hylaeus anthracinus]|uniref:uncharacterized protein LOC128891805 n=1 Tax=Hylaeus anthracinus TaxID=313031 RepID=UPI0023B941A0|nr:uncharacterized protein LOC128891805 [Hylaeus anthracinus]